MTYKELNGLVLTLSRAIGNKETKTQRKLFKIYEKVKHHYDEYLEKLEDLRLEHAQVDEKGSLILDEKGGYNFTKEGLKALNKAYVDLGNQEFTFEKIPVVNPQGLETLYFLKDWLSGVEFIEPEAKPEEEEEL